MILQFPCMWNESEWIILHPSGWMDRIWLKCRWWCKCHTKEWSNKLCRKQASSRGIPLVSMIYALLAFLQFLCHCCASWMVQLFSLKLNVSVFYDQVGMRGDKALMRDSFNTRYEKSLIVKPFLRGRGLRTLDVLRRIRTYLDVTLRNVT